MKRLQWLRGLALVAFLVVSPAWADKTPVEQELAKYGDTLANLHTPYAAEKTIDKLVKKYPERDVYNFAAIIYLYTQQWQKAFDVCTPGYKITTDEEQARKALPPPAPGKPSVLVPGPTPHQFLFCLAYSNMMLGNFEDAAEQAEQLLKREDTHEARFVSIYSNTRLRKYKTASKAAASALELGPTKHPSFIFYTEKGWIWGQHPASPILFASSEAAVLYKALVAWKGWSKATDDATIAELVKLQAEARAKQSAAMSRTMEINGSVTMDSKAGDKIRATLSKMVAFQVTVLLAEAHMSARRSEEGFATIHNKCSDPVCLDYRYLMLVAELARVSNHWDAVRAFAEAAWKRPEGGKFNQGGFYLAVAADKQKDDAKLAECVTAFEKDDDPWMKLLATYFKGRQLYKAGKLVEAKAAYDKAIGMAAEYKGALWSSYPYLARGELLMSQEKFQQADADLERAVEEDRIGANLLLWGINALRAKAFDKAEARFRVALNYVPKGDVLWDYLAITQNSQGKKKDALESLNKAVELAPKNAEHLGKRAAIKRDLGDAKGAMEDANASIAADPKVDWTLEMRAKLHTAQGNNDAAQRDLDAAKALKGK